jgi:hypothetical protein
MIFIGSLAGGSAVHFPSVTDLQDQYDQNDILNLIDDAVIADADAIDV